MEDMDEKQDVPEVLKEAQEKEKNKEESNNQQCGGTAKSRFAKAITDIIEEE